MSRPNLELPRPKLAVFFLACSGSGKSTLRQQIINELGATYVCNDEVRELLADQSGAIRMGIELKEVVGQTRDRILSETPNRFIVYDNNISSYYMHDDSYLNVAKKSDIPQFIIGINLTEELLVQRIEARGLPLMNPLAEQLRHQRLAEDKLEPDFVITDPADSGLAIGALKTKLTSLSS